jgi:NitT/TauT family transport system ATP-binding protein
LAGCDAPHIDGLTHAVGARGEFRFRVNRVSSCALTSRIRSGAVPFIEISDLQIVFGALTAPAFQAVEAVDLTIEKGEFVAIVGPSGCGKSSLLNAVAGLVPYTGSILVEGRPAQTGARQFGYMFQEGSLLPWRTAENNARIGLDIRGVDRAQANARVADLMNRVGLSDFKSSYPSQLSGGMKKRLSFVQIMAFDPEVLLMDEPFGALDFQTRLQVEMDLLREVERTGKTVIFVTHDIDEAIELADRIIVMTGRPGKIKSQYQVHLPRPRVLVESRGQPEFIELRRKIWEQLKHDMTG